MDKIEITKEEYYQLLCDSAELGLLESGGVDNWSQYSDSLFGKPDITDICDEIHERVFGAKDEI